MSATGAVDTTTSTGKLVLAILGAVAEFETDIRKERQKDGIEKAARRFVTLTMLHHHFHQTPRVHSHVYGQSVETPLLWDKSWLINLLGLTWCQENTAIGHPSG